jgi:hypothetical protein
VEISVELPAANNCTILPVSSAGLANIPVIKRAKAVTVGGNID